MMRSESSRIAMIGAGVMLLLTGSAVDGQQIPGTYRLKICAGVCEVDDTARTVAEGHIVLFESPGFLSTLPDSSREELTRGSYIRQPGAANACFSIPRRPAQVEGRELYAGIDPRGVTHWSDVDGRIQIRIYQSPDAHYTLDGHLEGDHLAGDGRQGICCGYGPAPETRFFAERVGPPDPQVCLSG